MSFAYGPPPGKKAVITTIRAVADAALKRLETGYIDLFCQQRIDPNVPIEDVAGAVQGLIDCGEGQALGTVRGWRANHQEEPCRSSRYSLAKRIFFRVKGARTGNNPHLGGIGLWLGPLRPFGKGISGQPFRGFPMKTGTRNWIACGKTPIAYSWRFRKRTWRILGMQRPR